MKKIKNFYANKPLRFFSKKQKNLMKKSQHTNFFILGCHFSYFHVDVDVNVDFRLTSWVSRCKKARALHVRRVDIFIETTKFLLGIEFKFPKDFRHI